jgi:hypothetical protein
MIGHVQRLFSGGLILWAVVMYMLLTISVPAESRFWPVVWVLLSSPVLLAVLAYFLEGRTLGEMFNPVHASWSFMFGDTFVLTTALSLCAAGWTSVPSDSWFRSPDWVLIGMLVGFAGGLAFHWWDGGNYTREGAEALLNSPTKLAHDFAAYPALLGALVSMGVPVLAYWSSASKWVILCLVLHLALMGLDALRATHPDWSISFTPFDLHPKWDAVNFRVL